MLQAVRGPTPLDRELFVLLIHLVFIILSGDIHLTKMGCNSIGIGQMTVSNDLPYAS